MPCCKHENVDARKDKAKHHSIAAQRYLPYAIRHEIWQGYGIRYSIDISLYNDITIERCIQRHGNDARKAKCRHIQETLLRECHSKAIPLSRLFSRNAIAPQNAPMPSCHSINQTQSCANLAPRLLQVACIIAYSLLRLISSDNDIASIMDMMPVSTSHVIDHAARCDASGCDYTISRAQHRAGHGSKESLFSCDLDATAPRPHAPMRDSSQRGNPSPHKNSYFLCQ